MQLQKSKWIGLSLLLASNVFAAEQVGTLVNIEGNVKLFTNPSKTLQADADGGSSRALFEGEYFRVREAKPGDQVENGNILRTAPGAKAWVIYSNGDQYHVGSGTAYRAKWDKDTANAHPEVTLMYGKLRGVVEKGGPRSKLRIRTSSATMGVRGTDFFVADDARSGGTEVSIIRGKVEVTPNTKNAKPLEVKSGETAAVEPVKPIAAPAKAETRTAALPPDAIKAEIRRTTQEDLKAILKTSAVDEKKQAAAPAEAAPKLEKLQAQAAQTTLKDIKTYDPELYARIEKNKNARTPATIAMVNAEAVQKVMETAPKAPSKRKPSKTELEDLDGGAYDKYFKPVK